MLVQPLLWGVGLPKMLPPAEVPPLAVGGEYIEEAGFVEVEDRSAVLLDAEGRK